jgi:hypothetical protein
VPGRAIHRGLYLVQDLDRVDRVDRLSYLLNGWLAAARDALRLAGG